MTQGSPWDAGREPWLARQGLLRNVVRQALVQRQLAAHLPPVPARVLDVGAGQGTQAIGLARLGYDVTAVEPDASMRQAMAATAASEPEEVQQRLRVLPGALGSLPDQIGATTFDVVCCHGVLMYLEQPRPAVVELCSLVASAGVLSLVARNADAMALRPGLRRDWAGVHRLLDSAASDHPTYVNELGVPARADRLEELASFVAGRRMHVERWYGVRVLTDGVPIDEPVPDDPHELAALLDAEERVGRTDPYRRLGTLLHVVGRRDAVLG
ncbi:MAG TPA: methyltransferase domain-containing protein [Actinomycetales bacterium]|nr:methyltransferase domain-containing protein [Actinomycetales bacterium]